MLCHMAVAVIAEGNEIEEDFILFDLKVFNVLKGLADDDPRIPETIDEGEAHVVEYLVDIQRFALLSLPVKFEDREPESAEEPLTVVFYLAEFFIKNQKYLLADIPGIIDIVHLGIDRAKDNGIIEIMRFGIDVSFSVHLIQWFMHYKR